MKYVPIAVLTLMSVLASTANGDEAGKHLIMRLPHGDDNFSTRIKRIKEDFTKAWRSDSLTEAAVTESPKKRGERGNWQPRFWEHLIEDEDDLAACIDYIHWNPRKHELVKRIRDWKWSSLSGLGATVIRFPPVCASGPVATSCRPIQGFFC